MTGFLYFLPDVAPGNKTELIAQFGLEHIADTGDRLHFTDVIRGPENRRGALVGNLRSWTVSDIRWNDSLHWKTFPKTHAARQALCAYLPHALPGPADLQRTAMLPGQPLTLADGRAWMIPHARRWEDGIMTIALPRTLDLNEETGEFVYGDVRQEYRKIWDHACRYWDAYSEAAKSAAQGDVVQFTVPNGTELVVDAIAANYRVSARELTILGALDDSQLNAIAGVLIDSAGMLELLKKTAAAIGTGSTGEPDSSTDDPADTDPPSPTCTH